MGKRDVEDAAVGAMLWSLTVLNASLDFAGRHWRWVPSLVLLLGVIARCHALK